MKAAPVLRAIAAHSGVRQTVVHTGQHYDAAMSEVFFEQLEMPKPDFNLGVGSGSHSRQTAGVMLALEPVLLERQPDLVLVYGDVNSTVAAALVCSKLGVRIGHVEAGLRSRDRSMPEEINRLLTDQLSDLLFTPSADGDENLLHEGVSAGKIFLVGNVMIDTLVRLLPRAADHFPVGVTSPYVLVTLHRPSNVDDLPWLRELLTVLVDLSAQLNVVFPVHPRTRQRLDALGSTHKIGPRLRLEGALALSGVSRSAALRRDGDHRLGRDSGRNHVSGRPLSHGARKYRTAHHPDDGNESACGTRSATAARRGGGNPRTGFTLLQVRVHQRRISCPFGTGTQPSASHKSSCEAPALQREAKREALRLQLRAGVRVDFAVQANFFKCRCRPFHDYPPSNRSAGRPRTCP